MNASTAPAARVIRCADVAGRPWRNGAGLTRELLTGPTTENWQWRISVADITRDAPFSLWAGVKRWFVPIEGAGVELMVDGLPHTLRLGGEPIVFDGAGLTTCRLLAGPTRDLNLMLRGAAGGLRSVVDGAAWEPGSAQCGLFTGAPGTCDVGGTELVLPAHTLVWWAEAPARLRFTAAAGETGAPGWWMAATPSRLTRP